MRCYVLTSVGESGVVVQVVNDGRWTTVGHVLTATYHRHVTALDRHHVVAVVVVVVGGLRLRPERAEHCSQSACQSAALLIASSRGRGAKYCDECVCLSARVTRKPHGRTSPDFCARCLHGHDSVHLTD